MAGPSRSRLGAVLAAIAFACLAGPAGAGAAGGKLSWSKCYGQLQCSTLQVPLDYAQPNGPTISLAGAPQPPTPPAPPGRAPVPQPPGPRGSGGGDTGFSGGAPC